MTRIDRLKSAIEDFRTTQDNLSNFGAGDTEPDGVFMYCVMRCFNREVFTLPTTGNDWQLLTSSMKCERAARTLTSKLKKVLRCIESLSFNDAVEIRPWLEAYCWRV